MRIAFTPSAPISKKITKTTQRRQIPNTKPPTCVSRSDGNGNVVDHLSQTNVPSVTKSTTHTKLYHTAAHRVSVLAVISLESQRDTLGWTENQGNSRDQVAF